MRAARAAPCCRPPQGAVSSGPRRAPAAPPQAVWRPCAENVPAGLFDMCVAPARPRASPDARNTAQSFHYIACIFLNLFRGPGAPAALCTRRPAAKSHPASAAAAMAKSKNHTSHNQSLSRCFALFSQVATMALD